MEWIRAEMDFIDSATQDIVKMTGHSDIRQTRFMIVYQVRLTSTTSGLFQSHALQRLTAYVATHVLCMGKKSKKRYICYGNLHGATLNVAARYWGQLAKELQQWRSWDVITVIKNHESIKDYLVDLFRQRLRVCPSRFIHSLLDSDDQFH